MLRPESGLRWKITLFLSAVVLVVMVILSVGDYLWQRQAYLNTLNTHIAEEARLVSALVANARTRTELQQMFARLVPTLERPDIPSELHEIFLIDTQGTIIASNQPGMVGQRMWNEDIRLVIQGDAQQRFGVMWHRDHLSYYGAVPLRTANDPAIAAVHIAEPYAPVLSRMQQFLRQRLMFMALVTLALILATIAATNYVILVPLQRLAATIDRVSRGDLDTHVDLQRDDELGAIARAFNRMVDALRISHRREEEKHRRLMLLYEINRRLAGVADWETLVEVILNLPNEIIPTTGVMFLSYDERSQMFTLEGARGLNKMVLAALEDHLARLKNPACLHCPPRLAHMDTDCPLLVPGLLTGNPDRMLCLHLAQGNHTVGFLYLLLPPEAPLSEDRVELLNAVSGEIAAAVAVAQARARELALLANLEQAQTPRASIQETLSRILQWTLDASQARRGAIFLFESETQHLHPAAWMHIEPEEIEEWRGIAWQGLYRREPLLISRRTMSTAAPEEIVIVPLHLGGEALGTLVLAGSGPRAYTRHHLMFLSAIAAQTALMVQSARLYERLEQQAVVEERVRLAREIHDGLAQNLAFVRWKMYQIQRWMEDGRVERLRDEIALLQQVVDEAYLDAREAIDGLRLPLNDDTSLSDALREYVRRFAARTGIVVDLMLDDVTLPPRAQAQLLRVVQEALSNVRKHAQATHVTICLREGEDGIQLEIADDGVGFDVHAVEETRHFGLRIMAERVQSLGGRLWVNSQMGVGTTVNVLLPTPHVRVTPDAS